MASNFQALHLRKYSHEGTRRCQWIRTGTQLFSSCSLSSTSSCSGRNFRVPAQNVTTVSAGRTRSTLSMSTIYRWLIALLKFCKVVKGVSKLQLIFTFKSKVRIGHFESCLIYWNNCKMVHMIFFLHSYYRTAILWTILYW